MRSNATRREFRAWAMVFGCIVWSVACASGPATRENRPLEVSVETLYPLRPGAAWSYDVDSGDGQPLLATARVLRVRDGVAEVSNGQAFLRYRVQPDGLQRLEHGGYLLKPPFVLDASWPSGPETSARITALHQALSTAAGNFEECVVVEERNSSSGQSVATTYCPGVGPARVVSQMHVRGQALRVVATLRGFATDPE